ncbi:MAG TPA: uroporphyrinogen decarboxylase family protein [Planctomycetota bacterium]|nr:uroporphyrinogen decarboxylase family protein [Planctomycetota bacterium]
MLSDRENYLRALQFRHPEWIPCSIVLLPCVWQKHREKLEDLAVSHPRIFKGFQRGSVDFDNPPAFYRRGDFRDNWGCLWHVAIDGAEGQVVEHPLADWGALKTFQPPDPLVQDERNPRDWAKLRQDYALRKQNGELRWGWGERLFDRLYALRGFENLMIDIATDDPRLTELIELLTDYELRLVKLWLETGVDVIGFHTDIGTQRALMISPAKFRKHIKPMFSRIFRTVRDAGVEVMLSSDGCLLEIVDDLIECGVSAHDPQIRANTLEGIRRAYKGRLCINLDLDRQMFMFCKPDDIRRQVKDAAEMLDSPEGGLMMWAAFCDYETPLENVEAACHAFEDYCLDRKTR